MTVALCRPKRQERLIPQPIAEEIRGMPAEQRRSTQHGRPSSRPSALGTASTPNTGNPKLDKKYQQQQEKQVAKQQQERDKLQQKQDQEHQKLAKQNANDEQKQQVEQKPPATDAAIAAKTPAAATAVAAETAASEPGAVQEIKRSFDGKASIVHGTAHSTGLSLWTFTLMEGLALQVRNSNRPNYASYGCGGRHPHPCNCVIAGNNWLAKRSLAIKASTHFKACSGTSTAPVSRMIGAWGLDASFRSQSLARSSRA